LLQPNVCDIMASAERGVPVVPLAPGALSQTLPGSDSLRVVRNGSAPSGLRAKHENVMRRTNAAALSLGES
jgi:hypothetical protein